MPMIDPWFQNVSVQNNLAATPSTTLWGTRITGTTTSATGKGTWQQMIASTTFASNALVIAWNGSNISGATSNTTMDVGIGGSGVENVLIPDLLVGWTSTLSQQAGPNQIYVPISVPINSRISARTRTSVANGIVDVALWAIGGSSGLPTPMFNRCDVYGLTSGGPVGTNITSGDSGAEGSWTDVGTTTTRPYGGILMLVSGTNTSVMSNLAYHFEFGIASVTWAEIHVETGTSEGSSIKGGSMVLPCSIPESTQLQVRGEASGTAQVIDVALYCFY